MTVNEGETTDEVSTAWGDVLINGEVKNDVKSGIGNIRVEGPVGGDVHAGSGDVYVDAPVKGKVHVGNGDLHLLSGARVSGPISVGSGTVFRDREAQVDVPQTAGMASGFDEGYFMGAFSGAIEWALMTMGLAALSVLLAVAAPGPLRASARSLETNPVRALVLGLCSVPAVVVISILLAVTVVGLLLLLLLWPAYLALGLFGALVAAYCLGRRIMLATGRYYRAGDALAAAVGALLVSAVWLIPILGGFVFLVLTLLGIGASVSAFTHRRLGAPHSAYTSYEDYLRDRRDTRSS
ncbi:MAG: polymer-forming cytoskeletal protein [Rubrobacter sp.]|nr:polymer-forming cytoskeletal protein [Rubrobacter sp.]